MLFPNSSGAMFRGIAWAGGFACLALAMGCKPEEQITKYTVRKHQLVDTASVTPANSPAAPKQMLGAIILTGDVGWFFKATDAPERVGPQADAFVTFVKSVRFGSGDDPEPTWTLPDEWRQLPASGLRHATILMGKGETAVELSVSRLGKSEPDNTQYLLSNINRWRGQIQLAPISAEDLSKTTIATQVDGRDCTIINITGSEGGDSGMSAAPFANRGGPTPPLAAGPLPPAGRSSAATPAGPAGVKFDKPEGWSEGPTNQFRKASFVVTEGDQKAEITVIDLSASNDWLGNVNRWREQVQLKKATATEVEQATKSISVGDIKGQYIEAVGETQTILGVMAIEGDKAWFIKLTGNKQLAEREKAHFEQFVKSLQFK